MRRPLAQREVALAGAAVLALAIALAVTTTRHAHKAAAALPPAVGSYTALAAASGPQQPRSKTACGIVLRAATVGLSSPVLPCGTRLYVAFRNRHALVAVVGRGPTGPGAEFLLTRALARELGVTGVKRIRWSYAGG